MEKKFELLNAGLQDSVNILSLDEMDGVVGGETKCKKGFVINKDGSSINCGCGFTTGTDIKLPGQLPGGGGTPAQDKNPGDGVKNP